MISDAAPPKEQNQPPVARFYNFAEANQRFVGLLSGFTSMRPRLEQMYPDLKEEGVFLEFEYPAIGSDQRAIELNFNQPSDAMREVLMKTKSGQATLEAASAKLKGADISCTIQDAKYTRPPHGKSFSTELVMLPNGGGFVEVKPYAQMPEREIGDEIISPFTVFTVINDKGTRKVVGYIPKGVLCSVEWSNLRAKKSPPMPAS